MAKKVTRSAVARGITLPVPIEANYVENYSLHFNELIDQIFLAIPSARVVLLIDEVDKAYSQFTDPHLDFDETFFGYLRGLSLTNGVTLVLAGGEELPALLHDLGPTFNNAVRVRVSYLDDDSVQRLIRNKHREWLDFPDPVVTAIGRLTHGNPFFTQHLCKELYDIACDEHSLQVSTRDVEKVGRRLVCEELTTEQMAHLYQLQESKEGRTIGLALLYQLSRDACLDTASVLHAEDLLGSIDAGAGAVRQTLNTLLEREVIRHVPEQPSHVQIVMPLFAAWFKERCPLNDDAWNLIKK